MSEDISDGTEDVVGVLTTRIEAHFGMSMDQLKAVVASPTAHRDASAFVAWHTLLVHSQTVLDRAEADLLAALETQPGEGVDDPTMALVRRVEAAVTVRDQWAVAVRRILAPHALAPHALAPHALAPHALGPDEARAESSTLAGVQPGPAVPTTPAPAPPATVPAAAVQRRGVLR
ncbi:hypothetical protein ACFXP3_21945 [Streptomyces sp. NPDC059096]|uniref:hypothetical protein n=1 Tax=Streptomyces sp. NPDC059096 TaxID=3346727 RepID=UPI0036A321AB